MVHCNYYPVNNIFDKTLNLMRKYYVLSLFLCITLWSYAQNYTVLGNASSLSGCNCFQLTPDADDQARGHFPKQSHQPQQLV